VGRWRTGEAVVAALTRGGRHLRWWRGRGTTVVVDSCGGGDGAQGDSGCDSHLDPGRDSEHLGAAAMLQSWESTIQWRCIVGIHLLVGDGGLKGLSHTLFMEGKLGFSSLKCMALLELA
jgi:hypothetical protein